MGEGQLCVCVRVAASGGYRIRWMAPTAALFHPYITPHTSPSMPPVSPIHHVSPPSMACDAIVAEELTVTGR